ncbi:MAG: ORF6N domain-containing protein [Sulfurovaceae bacterium]|nr:ORF6N domain-containing protein [Sulfurovaceae bacterium]
MAGEVVFEDIKNKLIRYKNEFVLLDSDIADIYGVQTRDINKAVANNPDKFPDGYVMQLTKEEKTEVVESFHHLEKIKFSPYLPKVFTEKALYMLATILKSKQAIKATIGIIETFAKIKELSRNINALENAKTQEEQNTIAKNIGEIFENIIDIEPATEKSGDEMIEVENRIELNIGFVKVSRTVKSKKPKNQK